MSGGDEDDKPTVVLDLNALKKQKLKQEEDLANIGGELEFNVDSDAVGPEKKIEARRPPSKMPPSSKMTQFHESELPPRQDAVKQSKIDFSIILFDFQSDFFKRSLSTFPSGFDYKIVTDLGELNQLLRRKEFQIAVFNYDVNPKAVNQLCAQIRQKFPDTKTLIMAKSISSEKAKVHAQTPSGASGYYQFPIETDKLKSEFMKIHSEKKVS